MEKRKEWLDITRTFAIVFVVLCHATETYYRPVLLGNTRISIKLWMVENFLFTLGRMGVPLFLAISGALLLGRDLNIKKFYHNSLLPLIMATELWTVLNYLFLCVFQREEFSGTVLIKQMLFLQNPSLSHMWYMPMIIGLYVVIPFLAKLMQIYCKTADFAVVYVCGVIISIICPTLNTLGKEAVTIFSGFSSKIDTSFWGGCYGLYLIGGYFIACRKSLAFVKSWILYLIASIVFLLNSMAQYYLYVNHFFKTNGLYWYSDFAVFILGLILFELFRRNFEGKKFKMQIVFEFIAKCSFGIYLIHKIILVLAARYCPVDGFNTVVKIGILFIIGFIGSIIALFPFKYKWKQLGKVVFLMK